MSGAPAIELPTIAILGTGSMGGAILQGLLAPDVLVRGGIRVTTRRPGSLDLPSAPGLTAYAVDDDPRANLLAVEDAAIVLVGVKPAGVGDLLDEIAAALAPDALVVSVAAGVTTAAMERRLPGGQPVVRAMPNTPATIRLGMTGVAAGSRATADHVELARTLFATVGDVLVVREDRIDPLSTISGSGPAYVFYLVEQLQAAASARGFADEEAALLAQSTFRGAVELLRSSGLPPAELRRRVTSPNGTTERAIAVFDEQNLPGVFDAATAAALARAEELGRDLA
ncbi:MAG: proC [Naasia sp.]|nr:proC [Naasia sp.]